MKKWTISLLGLVLALALVSCEGDSDNDSSEATDSDSQSESTSSSTPADPSVAEVSTPSASTPDTPLGVGMLDVELDSFSFSTAAAGDRSIDYNSMPGNGFVNAEMTYHADHFLGLGWLGSKSTVPGFRSGDKLIDRIPVNKGDDIYALMLWDATGMTVDFRIWWSSD